MVVLNKKKKKKKNISGCQIFQDECSPHEHWRGVTVSGLWQREKNNNRNNSMFSFGPRLTSRAQQHCSHLKWSHKWSTQKNLKWIFLSSFSYIKKKVFWDTGNNWIFFQTEQGCGGWGGHWEEFTASAALSSIEARTSIHLIPPPLRLSTACRSCGCRHRRFWQFHRAAQRFQWDERALVTGADKRGAATSQRSSSTQKQK